jgi:hypothetical protein
MYQQLIPKAPRLYQKDLKILSEFMQENFPDKSKTIVKKMLQKENVSSRMASFLRPSQLKSLSQTSVNARRAYDQTIPILQKVDAYRLRHPLT